MSIETTVYTNKKQTILQRLHHRDWRRADGVTGQQNRSARLDDALQSRISRVRRLHDGAQKHARRRCRWQTTRAGRRLEPISKHCLRLGGDRSGIGSFERRLYVYIEEDRFVNTHTRVYLEVWFQICLGLLLKKTQIQSIYHARLQLKWILFMVCFLQYGL